MRENVMNIEKIEFTLPGKWKKEIQKDCESLDLNMSQFMRLLVDEFLNGEPRYGYVEVGKKFSHPRKKIKINR